jgi:hypothetical protein
VKIIYMSALDNGVLKPADKKDLHSLSSFYDASAASSATQRLIPVFLLRQPATEWHIPPAHLCFLACSNANMLPLSAMTATLVVARFYDAPRDV